MVDIARHSETLEPMVIYKALPDPMIGYGGLRDQGNLQTRTVYKGDFPEGSLWVRPLAMFQENVVRDGKQVPRFRYIGLAVAAAFLLFSQGAWAAPGTKNYKSESAATGGFQNESFSNPTLTFKKNSITTGNSRPVTWNPKPAQKTSLSLAFKNPRLKNGPFKNNPASFSVKPLVATGEKAAGFSNEKSSSGGTRYPKFRNDTFRNGTKPSKK